MDRRIVACVLFLFLWLGAGIFITQPVAAQTVITVNTTADTIMDDGQCSLREAVIAANTDRTTGGCPAGSGADVIQFDSSLSPSAIFLLSASGTNEDNSATGDLDLRDILTIQGSDTDQIIIDGNNTDRVFEIMPGATIILSKITIRNGNPGNGANGGGILVTGGMPRAKLSLVNSAVMDNTATNGGGIQNMGNGASVIIESTLISSNKASVSGGGISNTGSVEILNSTLAQNTARTGGGIDHSGFSLNLTNTTISNNRASDDGGGFYNRADAIFLNVTLSDNAADGVAAGGNIFNDTASLSIKNSIVTNSELDGNCFNNEGMFNSLGFNIDNGNTCGFASTGDMINVDPLLGDLQDNQGSTLTHALLAGSPAIDHGDNKDCPEFDQRGFTRPADGDGNGNAICDIGAFELDGIPPTSTPTPQPAITPSPSATPSPTPQIPPCSSSAALLASVVLLLTRPWSGWGTK